ncbi:hypothetical protein BDQ12DRAFT_712160 [Crucibulum laeve]|uniref:N-acetyltransferase domain-containing protein n=1 Tax=Crucibulum laeve TaxID=68775 RepID=A0A5C3M3Y1_9AGAR|nr:hypothetical protein BDQ12DRAFT_712160 [Crucibulum laeve]
MSMAASLQPLVINPHTYEPVLRLDAPYQNIIIIPPRMEDVEPSVVVLNDPEVYPWMGIGGPDNPYTKENAQVWIERVKTVSDGILREIKLRNNREETGFQVDGYIGIERGTWAEIIELEERQRLVNANHRMEVGDKELWWQIGYYLSPTHHSQGTMSAAIGALINKWAIPRMGAKKIRATSFNGNRGSMRAMQKNGFVLAKTLEGCVQVQGEEAKRDLRILEWSLGAD